MKKIILLCVIISLCSNVWAQDYVQIGNDSIHFEIKGSGEPWIILVHGVTGRLEDLNPIFYWLSQKTTVVRYSRAGNGFSTYHQRNKTFDSCVEELNVFLEKINAPDKVILGGFSFGGLITRAFATKYPERVQALVSLEATFEEYFKVLSEIEPNAVEMETESMYGRDSLKIPIGIRDDLNALFHVWKSPEKWDTWFNYPESIPHCMITATHVNMVPLRTTEEFMQARYEAQKRIIEKSKTMIHIVLPDADHYVIGQNPGICIDAFDMMIHLTN
ncbi:alpha/beta fold hydrolase [Maribellus mangrovi]|uniref:alpha/beta fold hydrolase n=1 Tax=Maribellus mangrovi TaxID=3133146 RepID=UPI0030ED88B9